MHPHLRKPVSKAIIFEDQVLYVCLATYPVTRGHVIIVWKKQVPDLHQLKSREYAYLMDTVSTVRNAMLKALKVKKVYLVYMDEARHVHWHLIPRYDEKGFNVFLHKPIKSTDYSLAKRMKRYVNLT